MENNFVVRLSMQAERRLHEAYLRFRHSNLHSLWRLTWGITSLPEGHPLVASAVTDEVDPPYRQARGFVLKFSKARGLVLGWWHNEDRDEWDALLSAVRGSSVGEVVPVTGGKRYGASTKG